MTAGLRALTVAQVCQALQIGHTKFYEPLKAGELPCRELERLGRSRRFCADDLEAYLRCQNPPAAVVSSRYFARVRRRKEEMRQKRESSERQVK